MSSMKEKNLILLDVDANLDSSNKNEDQKYCRKCEFFLKLFNTSPVCLDASMQLEISTLKDRLKQLNIRIESHEKGFPY